MIRPDVVERYRRYLGRARVGPLPDKWADLLDASLRVLLSQPDDHDDGVRRVGLRPEPPRSVRFVSITVGDKALRIRLARPDAWQRGALAMAAAMSRELG